MPAVMSYFPLAWPLVASALLTMDWIVTCRPSAANSPWSCAMYRPALSATGTAPTVRFVFSRSCTFGRELLGLLHPAPARIDSPAVVTVIARRSIRLIFPLDTNRGGETPGVRRSGFPRADTGRVPTSHPA